MDEQIEVFGRRMPVEELLKIIGWAVSHAFRKQSQIVMRRCGIKRDELVNEIVITVLTQSRNPKWSSGDQVKASTAIIKCADYTMRSLNRYYKQQPMEDIIVGDDLTATQAVVAAEIQSASEITDRLAALLPDELADLIKRRYGGQAVASPVTLGKALGLKPKQIERMERRAFTLLRQRADEIL